MGRISWSTGTLVILSTLHLGAQQPSAIVPVTPVPPAAVVSARGAKAATASKPPLTRPSVFMTIQGTALNSSNGALPFSFVRLRDARFGRIAHMTTTDRAGLFAFRPTDPGSYVVELVSQDQMTILAASQILNVNAGELVSAVVKLPVRISAAAGVLGQTTPSAAVVTSLAAASGVLATAVTQSVSPAR